MITNKLTFDPPTRLPKLTQNLIRSSHGHGHSTPSLKTDKKDDNRDNDDYDDVPDAVVQRVEAVCGGTQRVD